MSRSVLSLPVVAGLAVLAMAAFPSAANAQCGSYGSGSVYASPPVVYAPAPQVVYTAPRYYAPPPVYYSAPTYRSFSLGVNVGDRHHGYRSDRHSSYRSERHGGHRGDRHQRRGRH